jgi:hypothetical protein
VSVALSPFENGAQLEETDVDSFGSKSKTDRTDRGWWEHLGWPTETGLSWWAREEVSDISCTFSE